ncbi:hypothetical protein [Rhodophyticola sp.]|jgi:hypothetical protein|uniref:hypothetical protein n=1 Tax=Rhodophyticola sp. TaxID=2680032 RepID=UPI003D296B3E
MQRQQTTTQTTTTVVRQETQKKKQEPQYTWRIEDFFAGVLALAGLLVAVAVIGFALYYLGVAASHAVRFVSGVSIEVWRVLVVVLSVLASTAMVFRAFTVEPEFIGFGGPNDPNEDILSRYLKTILKSVGVSLVVLIPMLLLSWWIFTHLPFTAIALGLLAFAALFVMLIEVFADISVLLSARSKLGPRS